MGPSNRNSASGLSRRSMKYARSDRLRPVAVVAVVDGAVVLIEHPDHKQVGPIRDELVELGVDRRRAAGVFRSEAGERIGQRRGGQDCVDTLQATLDALQGARCLFVGELGDGRQELLAGIDGVGAQLHQQSSQHARRHQGTQAEQQANLTPNRTTTVGYCAGPSNLDGRGQGGAQCQQRVNGCKYDGAQAAAGGALQVLFRSRGHLSPFGVSGSALGHINRNRSWNNPTKRPSPRSRILANSSAPDVVSVSPCLSQRLPERDSRWPRPQGAAPRHRAGRRDRAPTHPLQSGNLTGLSPVIGRRSCARP